MSDSEVSSECSYAYSCYSDNGEESYGKGCKGENSENIATCVSPNERRRRSGGDYPSGGDTGHLSGTSDSSCNGSRVNASSSGRANAAGIKRGEATGDELFGDRCDRALAGECSKRKRAKYTMEEDYDNDLTRDFVCMKSNECAAYRLEQSYVQGSKAERIVQWLQKCKVSPINGQEKLVEGGRDSINFYLEKSHGSTQLTATEEKAEAIVQWLRKFPVSPMNYIFSKNIWLTSKWKFLNPKSALMGNILKIHASFYNNLSIEELYTHFMSVEPQNLIFNSPKGNIDNYYYGIEESIDVCEKLIAYQFHNNEDQIKNFYDCLFAVINKTRPKKNSIFIISPPNAGKSFFFDAVVHYFINYGQMGNFNTYCSFPFMECVNKRIILWDHPFMEQAAAKTLKCILGGDNINAKYKYQNDAVIMRTPVIILSNSDIFPKNESIRTTMYQFNWRPAQFLINYKLKAHPLCFYHLYNKYSKM